MATNKVRKRIYTSTNFTVPAGVTKLRLISETPRFRKLSAGSGKTAQFIDQDLAAYGRGENANGQLGVGSVTYSSTPLLVLGTKKWKAIYGPDGASQFFFGLDQNGDLYAWGVNSNFSGGTGVLGTGDSTPKSTPTLVVGGKKWRELFISSGSDTVFAADSEGLLYGWGVNSSFGSPSLIGNGDNATAAFSSPVLVTGSRKVKAMTQSLGPMCIIDTDGNAWTWGQNRAGVSGSFPDFVYKGGMLGNGDSSNTSSTSTPVLVSGGHKWKKIVSGQGIDVGFGLPLGQYFIGITDDGKLWGWGGSNQAIYPNGLDTPGNETVQSTPVLVIGQGSKKYIDIATTIDGSFGTTQIHALTEDGEIYSWGPGTKVLGIGVTTGWVSTPTLVVGGHKFKKMITPRLNGGLGTAILAAINDAGDLYIVGSNQGSTVQGTGDTDGAECSTPRIVIGSRKWADLAISVSDWNSFYGLTRNGNIYFWGSVADGDSAAFTRSSPTLMNGAVLTLNPINPQEFIEVEVTPGEVVPIEMNGLLTTVKGEPFAKLAGRVIIEYES